jgi:UDP:flavonoid glycosyltransferase YjiC (YdhE family)
MTEKIPPLNILIFAFGTRGDVQPFIAFAKELKKHNHHVRIATFIKFKDFVESYNIDFYPIKGILLKKNTFIFLGDIEKFIKLSITTKKK